MAARISYQGETANDWLTLLAVYGGGGALGVTTLGGHSVALLWGGEGGVRVGSTRLGLG